MIFITIQQSLVFFSGILIMAFKINSKSRSFKIDNIIQENNKPKFDNNPCSLQNHSPGNKLQMISSTGWTSLHRTRHKVQVSIIKRRLQINISHTLHSYKQ